MCGQVSIIITTGPIIKRTGFYTRYENGFFNLTIIIFNFRYEARSTTSKYRRAFSLIFFDSVPQFSDSASDQCRRFISLIDMLYDQQRSVVILAQFPINQLCQINKLSKEFERTASRLYEMTIINQKK